MPSTTTCSWLDDAIGDVEHLVATAGAGAGRRVGVVVSRLERMNGGTSLRDALLRPGSTPFVPLIDALAADLGLAGDPRVARIGRATLLLYVYVRIQDDLVDEEALVDRASVFAMEATLAAHLARLAEAGLPQAAWAARSRVMARFAAVAADEVDARAAGAGLAPERAGEKFLAMAVPLVALASAAGRDALHDDLSTWVVHVGTALQMINDVLNAAEDHAAGRPTAVLAWARADLAAAADTPNRVRAALVGHPAVDRALDVAADAAARAWALAERHELPRLADIAAGVAAQVGRTRERLLGLMLGVQA